MPRFAPTDLAEALSPDWLTFALGDRYPGVRVAGLMVLEEIVTMATKVRFAVEYAEAPENTPRNFCLKGLFGDHVGRMRSAGVMETEARFYSEVAPRLSLRLPTAVYSRLAEDGPYATIIMRDVIESQGAHFLTALNPYSVDEAAASLDQLAQLHAAGWRKGALDRWPWLTSRVAYFAYDPPVPLDRLNDMMAGVRGEPLPLSLRDGSRQFAALDALVRRVPKSEHTLVHGDCHAGNVYETDAGPSLVDWQLLQRASWALDLSYHIAAVLMPDVREQSQRHLIDHYLECLRREGVEAPSRENAWREYRAHMAYGFHMWAITQKVEPEITNEFVRRLGLAVASLETFELLGV
jgi:aminoglycoside phosphotransferase (APT) family kinase protein